MRKEKKSDLDIKSFIPKMERKNCIALLILIVALLIVVAIAIILSFIL